MSRPWIKLSTDIHRHPRLGLLSDSAWRRYVECLSLAGDIDRDGELDTPPAVARLLYVSLDQLERDIAEMGGRIFLGDEGILHVRDWSEHQPAKRTPEPAEQVTERSRRHRAASVQRDGNADATHEQRSGNDALEVEVDVEVEEDVETEESGAADAPPPTTRNGNGSKSPDGRHHDHDAFFAAVCGACGMDTHLLNAIDRANVGKLSRDLARAQPPWDPHDVWLAGREWQTVKWKSKRPSAVTPPTIAQLRTWLGECRVRWSAEADFDAVVQR